MLLQQEISVVGCGRTDAGVHDSSYYAHFDLTDKAFPYESRRDWAYRLSALLDKEISVFSVFDVPQELHVRFSARQRTYRYPVHTHKDPFAAPFSYHCRFAFDAGLVR